MSQLTRFILIPACAGALLGLVIILLDSGNSDDRPGYARAVALAAPAVVNITAATVRPTNPICNLKNMRPFCRGIGQREQTALGSGVIVRADGYVLTNAHVVQDANVISVMFSNSQQVPGHVVGIDSQTDLAIVKVDAEGLPVIHYDANHKPRVGDVALAIGNPFGLGHSVSQGIISALSRPQITDSPYDDFFQTDALINPGNSGGALIDHEGSLLGINTSVFRESNGGNAGIGFAIPAPVAMEIMEEIITHGRVVRGWLGVSLSTVRLTDNMNGMRVDGVVRGGPAHQAGIRRGDVVLSVNQLPMDNFENAANAIARAKPGTELKMEVLREQQRFHATAVTGELPPMPKS